MTLRNYIILILIIKLFGCVEKNKTLENKLIPQYTVETSISDELVETIESPNKNPLNESKDETEEVYNLVQLKFKEFFLEIDNIYVWDEEEKLKETQVDTTVVHLVLGETIEGKVLRIKPLIGGKFEIYQRFENSVTVMNEGPHCDLREWKHYDSEWEKLEIHNGKFLTISYPEENLEKFIEVDMNELREAVKNQCGDVWAENIKDVKSPTEYPCGVSISRIFLKIKFSSQDSTMKEKIVIFEVQMGC